MQLKDTYLFRSLYIYGIIFYECINVLIIFLSPSRLTSGRNQRKRSRELIV